MQVSSNRKDQKAMEGNFKLLIPLSLQPSQNGKSWQNTHVKKKTELQVKEYKECINEYLDKIDVFKLARPY